MLLIPILILLQLCVTHIFQRSSTKVKFKKIPERQKPKFFSFASVMAKALVRVRKQRKGFTKCTCRHMVPPYRTFRNLGKSAMKNVIVLNV